MIAAWRKRWPAASYPINLFGEKGVDPLISEPRFGCRGNRNWRVAHTRGAADGPDVRVISVSSVAVFWCARER